MSKLLNPRFRLINTYPDCKLRVGQIIEPDEFDVEKYRKYPHIFTELKWYEERKLEDLPKTLKHKEHDLIYNVVKYQISSNLVEVNTDRNKNVGTAFLRDFEPIN